MVDPDQVLSHLYYDASFRNLNGKKNTQKRHRSFWSVRTGGKEQRWICTLGMMAEPERKILAITFCAWLKESNLFSRTFSYHMLILPLVPLTFRNCREITSMQTQWCSGTKQLSVPLFSPKPEKQADKTLGRGTKPAKNRQNLKTKETKVKTNRNCSDKKCYTTDQEDKANWQLGEGKPGLYTEGGATTRHRWDTDETLPKVEQEQREQVKTETLQEDETVKIKEMN